MQDQNSWQSYMDLSLWIIFMKPPVNIVYRFTMWKSTCKPYDADSSDHAFHAHDLQYTPTLHTSGLFGNLKSWFAKKPVVPNIPEIIKSMEKWLQDSIWIAQNWSEDIYESALCTEHKLHMMYIIHEKFKEAKNYLKSQEAFTEDMEKKCISTQEIVRSSLLIERGKDYVRKRKTLEFENDKIIDELIRYGHYKYVFIHLPEPEPDHIVEYVSRYIDRFESMIFELCQIMRYSGLSWWHFTIQDGERAMQCALNIKSCFENDLVKIKRENADPQVFKSKEALDSNKYMERRLEQYIDRLNRTTTAGRRLIERRKIKEQREKEKDGKWTWKGIWSGK